MRKTGLKRILCAFGCSWCGLHSCFRSEAAFRQEVMLGCFLVPLSCFVAHSPGPWLMLNAAYVFILIVELLNTAVERAVDRISLDQHALSKDAKDMGSAAVLLSFALLVACWASLLF